MLPDCRRMAHPRGIMWGKFKKKGKQTKEEKTKVILLYSTNSAGEGRAKLWANRGTKSNNVGPMNPLSPTALLLISSFLPRNYPCLYTLSPLPYPYNTLDLYLFFLSILVL